MVALAPSARPAASHKTLAPAFKQYREADGKFYFKLVAADGRVLLQSHAFDSGRDAGLWIARLKADAPGALGDAPPVTRAPGVSAEEVLQALASGTP
jgi:tryptophanyl-tRNA synthetase